MFLKKSLKKKISFCQSHETAEKHRNEPQFNRRLRNQSTDSFNGKHGKSLSMVVICKMNCISYTALQCCEKASIQFKGENYIRGVKKVTCQQNGLV